MTHLEFTTKIFGLHHTLRSFSKRFTQDHDESSDLVQDTILKALVYMEKFREDTNLKGWLFTIMKNTFINNYRKSKASQFIRDSSNTYHQIIDEHTFSSPDSKFEYDDIWENIYRLHDELLIPFKMHTAGYKYHEIATHMNIPIGTVKTRIFHARKEIQKILSGY